MIMPESPLWQWHKTEPKRKNRACQAGRTIQPFGVASVRGSESVSPRAPMPCHAMPERYIFDGATFYFIHLIPFRCSTLAVGLEERIRPAPAPAPAYSISAAHQPVYTHWPRVHIYCHCRRCSNKIQTAASPYN